MSEGHDIMQPQNEEHVEEYKERLSEYLRKAEDLKKSDRPIPGNKDIPGYCYVLSDLPESMHRRCRRTNLRITSDGMGYLGYNEPSHAYIEVISFDQLMKAAKERNRAFFDKLGLPSA